MAGKEPIRIRLTKEQQDQILKATGKSAEMLELTAQELEDRIAPMQLGGKRGLL